MTSPNRIEQTPRPAQAARMAAGQAKAPDASGDGFALMLSLLGGPEGAPLALLPDDPADARGSLQDPQDPQDALGSWGEALQADAAPVPQPQEQAPDASGLLPSPWAIQMLVSQTVPNVPNVPNVPDSASTPAQTSLGSGLEGMAWQPTSLVAETGRLDAASAAQADLGVAGPALPQPGAARPRPAVSWTVAAAASTAASEQLSGRRQAPAAVLAQPAAPVPASASLAAIGPARQDVAGSGPHAAATAAQPMPLAAGAAEAVLAQGAGPGVDAGLPAARRGDSRAVAQEPIGAAAPGIDSTQSVPGTEGASSGSWQDGSADAQAQLAEDVAWWASQQTQSAALTLDADGQPVQVQVTLNGDQAHIVFHSDEAQARQLLDANVDDLRALLDAQGLQLAGVTVGQSGAGAQGRAGQGNGSGQPGADMRRGQARVAAAGEASAAPARRASGAQRAVDVFV